MTTVSRDYKPRRIPPPSGPRRIPLVRIALLLGLVYFGVSMRSVWQGSVVSFVSNVQKSLPQFSSKTDTSGMESLNRKERLAMAGGKIFLLKNGCIQESWRLQSSKRLESALPLYNDPRINSLVRTLVGVGRPRFVPGVLDLVFRDTTTGRLPLFARWRDSVGTASIVRMAIDSLGTNYKYFDSQTQCVWLEPCAVDPLQGGAVPIGIDFDFAGRKHLLTHDLFLGIGEAPVVAVLRGVVRKIDLDPAKTLSIEIVHESNQFSRMEGLASVEEGIHVGSRVERGEPLGRLSARDTSQVVFQFLRNGSFVRWDDFQRESRPVPAEAIATFQASLFQ